MTGRIMAIDYGSKRIGIAFSDSLRIFAKAHSVLENCPFDELLIQIKSLAEAQNAGLIIVGMPYAIDGSYSPKTIETAKFYKKLQESLSIPVVSYDERYSSQEAEVELKKMGKSWQESRKMVDAMAAAMILKSYLENEEKS
ncbi:MAG: Holliday junction resolvase RuvX [Candidatus Cloacimonetes bacterium]|jgi:putative Holliday junction resolvase|nr:Holliday junction resolvase RuvX [Candidatus Cloacimonadota bacterium]MDY0298987.1 Holliday junction resolvase RuvX [Candidatus Cloacimonadaceae bacterium]MCB5278605.1 Holliday junction resolvase RuvX [Candidatus Cloacimonadota bacterium]MCK9331995.1 Holliday junction resolvase RuvX [Candidatus Cloacimonadota bacterium]MDD2210352.1 Holliday junction resolvase RuvX [Candidatus Cloacimonadota bacterium]